MPPTRRTHFCRFSNSSHALLCAFASTFVRTVILAFPVALTSVFDTCSPSHPLTASVFNSCFAGFWFMLGNG